jgi:hypothetical protein
LPLLLNFSQCKLYEKEYYKVIEHCSTVLKSDPGEYTCMCTPRYPLFDILPISRIKPKDLPSTLTTVWDNSSHVRDVNSIHMLRVKNKSNNQTDST